MHKVKKVLNQVHEAQTEDDLRILDSWIETKGNGAAKDNEIDYFCYKLETMDPETGKTNILYKAVKFARVTRLPKSAKQSTSFMDMQTQVLSAVHEQGYNLITAIANVIKPRPEGLMYLYGVQGVSDDIDDAKKRADLDFNGFIRSMMGTFRVLHMRNITAEEGNWLQEKMRGMKFMTAVRGIPKANTEGEDVGNKGLGGSNVNPDSQGTIEEIITAMADYEYVIEVLSTPVYNKTLMSWQTSTQKQMTEWYGQLQGTKNLSFNLSMPMTYMTSTGSSQGWSKNYTDSSTVSYTQGESYTNGFSQSAGQSLSQSLGESFGLSQGTSLTNTIGENHSISSGLSRTEGVSMTEGFTQGQSMNVTNGITRGQTIGQSITNTQGTSIGTSIGNNVGVSNGSSIGSSLGTSVGESNTLSNGISDSLSASQSYGTSQGTSANYSRGENSSESTTQSISNGNSISNSVNSTYGQSSNLSHSVGTNESETYGSTQGISAGGSATTGQSRSVGENTSVSANASKSSGTSTNAGYNYTNSANAGTSNSETSGSSGGFSLFGGTMNLNGSETGGTSNGIGSSVGGSYGYGTSATNSSGASISQGINQSDSASVSTGSNWSESASNSQSYSAGLNESYSAGSGSSYSEGYGASYGETQSQSLGVSNSNGLSYSESVGTNYGTNASGTTGQSSGTNSSVSQGQNLSNSGNISNSANESNSLGYSVSQNISQSSSTSVGQSYSDSLSQSYSESMGESISNSYSQGTSSSIGQNYSESDGTSVSQAVGQSESNSYTQSVSNGTGQNWSESSSISQGQSNSTSNGQSTGTSIGSTGAFTTGTSGSFGLGPSIGYSKSYQWMDQQVKDILELLEYQNERIKKALRGEGAFYTYVYIACPDMESLATAQAAAKSTWQNEYAMAQPLQVLDLADEEQQHLLYHFRAFSADVSRENVAGVSDYKYATVLLADEYVAYTHLPRVSEGGIDTNIDDIPKFRVPGLLRGDIYMGTELNSERYTFNNGYRTQFDYRIDIDELMHAVFTGASRSGKTVAAMRFVSELANARRTATGKRLRIVIMDPKQDWRGIARFVEPERFRFYSLGNTHFHPISMNPCKIPYNVEPQHWIDGIINIYCRSYGLLERGKQMMSDVFYELYKETGIFDEKEADKYGGADSEEWKREISERSGSVTFHKIYKRMEAKQQELTSGGKRAGNDTLDAYARLLERLSCFSRQYSIEYRLFSQEDNFNDPNSKGLGMGIDELIGDDDITVFESFGLESTFANFIFGIITSGFYKVAKSYEKGFLNPEQYETVLVIEEANKVLTGNDTAGTGGSQQASLSGQSEFEEILDQAAGYGLFIVAITQKISQMPSSIVANCGLFFLGKISHPDDVNLAVRMIGREERVDDRDVVKWLPKSPTGWFICRSNRGYDFRDAEPVLVQIDPLNSATISNAELDEILIKKEMSLALEESA